MRAALLWRSYRWTTRGGRDPFQLNTWLLLRLFYGRKKIMMCSLCEQHCNSYTINARTHVRTHARPQKTHTHLSLSGVDQHRAHPPWSWTLACVPMQVEHQGQPPTPFPLTLHTGREVKSTGAAEASDYVIRKCKCWCCCALLQDAWMIRNWKDDFFAVSILTRLQHRIYDHYHCAHDHYC